MRLGIDFGTTRTVVAAVHDGRHPLAVFDTGGEFPSTSRASPLCAAAIHRQAGRRRAPSRPARPSTRSDRSSGWPRRSRRTMPVPGLPGTSALELVTAFLAEVRRGMLEQLQPRDRQEAARGHGGGAGATSSRQRWLTLEAVRGAPASSRSACSTSRPPRRSSSRTATWARSASAARSATSWSTTWAAARSTRRRCLLAGSPLRPHRHRRAGPPGRRRLRRGHPGGRVRGGGTSPAPGARAAALERVREAKEGLRPTSGGCSSRSRARR